ncbi:hypothetical protein [Pseudoalteromonas rubra]
MLATETLLDDNHLSFTEQGRTKHYIKRVAPGYTQIRALDTLA